MLEKELANVNSLEEIQDAVLRIETDGDQAVIYHNMTAAQWASYLIGLAESVLPEYEKGYLANV